MQHDHRSRIDSVLSASYEQTYLLLNDVVWGRQRSIDQAQPTRMPPTRDRRKLKLQWLPISVDCNIAHLATGKTMESECKAVGVITPVGFVEFDAMPFDMRLAEILLQSDRATSHPLIEVQSNANHVLHKPQNVCVGGA